MAATAKEIREWAKVEGIDVPARGPIPPRVLQEYEQSAGEFDDDDVTAAGDAPGAPPGDEGQAAAAPPPRPDVPPARRPGRQRSLSLIRGGATGTRTRRRRKTRARKTWPRVSVEDTIETAWAFMASAVRFLPPTSRMLTLQAPMAGALLEDAVKDTLIDRMLQPVARNQERAVVFSALVVPPLLTTAITLNPDAAGPLMPLLRKSMIMMVKAGGPKVIERMEQEQQDEDELGQRVDKLLRYMFGDPPGDPEQAAEWARDVVTGHVITDPPDAT